ncbi:hypothetical protein ACIQG8_12665 [Pseudarthrobacter oxydans]
MPLWLMATEADVRRIALAMTGVTERLSWGQLQDSYRLAGGEQSNRKRP